MKMDEGNPPQPEKTQIQQDKTKVAQAQNNHHEEKNTRDYCI